MKEVGEIGVAELNAMTASIQGSLPFYAVDRERWTWLPIFDQMGNIGTEAGRTMKLNEYLVSVRSHRSKEVLRARDQFLQCIFITDDPSLETYFMQFAIAARINR